MSTLFLPFFGIRQNKGVTTFVRDTEDYEHKIIRKGIQQPARTVTRGEGTNNDIDPISGDKSSDVAFRFQNIMQPSVVRAKTQYRPALRETPEQKYDRKRRVRETTRDRIDEMMQRQVMAHNIAASFSVKDGVQPFLGITQPVSH
jgi:hypothetical protein